MATTNFENANLRLLITDTGGIVTTASLQQTAGSSGSGGGLLAATVTLTDAQIRSLPTPAIIIPPTEIVNYLKLPASIPKVIVASAVINALAGAYDPGCKLFLAYGSPADFILGESVKWNQNGTLSSTGIGTSVEKRIFSFLIGENCADQDISDNALVLTSSGAPLGGHTLNTLKIVVQYVLLNT